MSTHTSIAGDCACHELLKAEIALTFRAAMSDVTSPSKPTKHQ